MTSIPETSGIYRITCTPTGKFYIGSAINLRERWREHRKNLRGNRHVNKHLQNAWNKHCEDAFTFEVLELVLAPFLTAREQYWFDKLKPFGKRGFNVAIVAGSSYGITHSPETREKIRQARLVQPNPALGVKRTPEWLERQRLAHLGKKAREETKQKMREAQLGRKHSEETKAKMSRSRIGYKHTPEAIGKMRASHANISDQTRAKLSASIKGKITSRMKTLIVTSPDGTQYVVQNMSQFCQEHGLDSSSLFKVAKGKTSQSKGWKASYLDMPDSA